MIYSPARAIANIENSKRSTGPSTPQGKARSRCNALKHGLTGEGIALPEEDAAEIARRFNDLQGQFHPATPMGKIMVHRIALMSVRLERCALQETAHIGEKMRHARQEYDEQRQLEVVKLFQELADSPAAAVRRLLRTPEGIEALIAAWLDLKADLGRAEPRFWTVAHCKRANLLYGRKMDDVPGSRINDLSSAIQGDFSLLRAHDGAGLDPEARQDWARQALDTLIAEEIEDLRDCFANLDHEAFELDREEAPRRALFDTSKPAVLARRYEAAAERNMFRALKELREVEREAAENPPVPQDCQNEPLASFGNEEIAPVEEDDEPSFEPEECPKTAFPWPSRVEMGLETVLAEGEGCEIGPRRSVS